MKQQSKTIAFLRSSNFAIWVAILSMMVQSFHSYTAFQSVSSLQNMWGIAQSTLFAIIIDSAILFYTVRNRKDIALGAAFIMVVINSYYYYINWGWSFNFLFGVFLSLIIPASVYFYSEEVGKEDEEGPGIDAEKETMRHRIKDLENTIFSGKAENKRLSDRIDNLQAEGEGFKKVMSGYRGELEAAHKRIAGLLAPAIIPINEALSERAETSIKADIDAIYKEINESGDKVIGKPEPNQITRTDRPMRD